MDTLFLLGRLRSIANRSSPYCCKVEPLGNFNIIQISLLYLWETSESEVAQSCPTLCDSMDGSLPVIFQALVLEWVAISFSRGSSRPRDRTRVSCIIDRRFTSEPNKNSLKIGRHSCPSELLFLHKWRQKGIGYLHQLKYKRMHCMNRLHKEFASRGNGFSQPMRVRNSKVLRDYSVAYCLEVLDKSLPLAIRLSYQ